MKDKRTKFVVVAHPDCEGEGRVPIEAVAIFEDLGWTVVGDDPRGVRQVVEPEPEPEPEPLFVMVNGRLVSTNEAEWTTQGPSDQEGDEEPDVNEESIA